MYSDDFERFYQIANNNQEYRNDTIKVPTINRNRASSLRENSRRGSRNIQYSGNTDEMFKMDEKHLVSNRKNSSSHKASTDRLTNNSKYLSPVNQISPAPSEARRHSLYPTLPTFALNETHQASRRQLPSISPGIMKNNISSNIRRGSSPNPGLNYSRDASPKEYRHNFDLNDGKNIIRVRSFKRTKQGLVNRGDKNVCLSHKDSEKEIDPNYLRSPSICSVIEDSNQVTNEVHANRKTCQVIGGVDVGKSVLCKQFLHSESIIDHDYDTIDDESSFSFEVEIDGETTTIQMTDTTVNMNDFDTKVIPSVDAYIVVYAVDDKNSFLLASEILKAVISCSKRSSALLLVANKNDLVRTKAVTSEEGKTLSDIYNASFFEISVSLNHQIDNLLVGLVSAIEIGIKNVQKEVKRLSGRLASISPIDQNQLPIAGRRESLFNTISKSSRGKVVSNFFKKHFK